jgi:hypothetical protein
MVDRVVHHFTEGILGGSPAVRRDSVREMQALSRFPPEDVLLEPRRDVLLKEIGRRSPPGSGKSAPSQRFSDPSQIEQAMAAAGASGGDAALVRQLADAGRRDTELSGNRADPHEVPWSLHTTNLHTRL